MRRGLTLVACWIALGTPARALVGDASPVDWAVARVTVIVASARSLCSGVVLAQDLVLTAAHCVVARNDYRIVSHATGKPVKLADVREIASHPRYEAKASPLSSDLALLKTSKPMPASVAPAFSGIVPVSIGDRLIVVGYGITAEADPRSAGKPRMALLTVQERSSAMIALADQSRSGTGVCSGDSGAPVFATRGGVPALVGIVSRGNFCGGITYAVPFAAHRDWIEETARKLGSALNP